MELVDGFIAEFPNSPPSVDKEEITLLRQEAQEDLDQIKQGENGSPFVQNRIKERFGVLLDFVTKKTLELNPISSAMSAVNFSDLTSGDLNYLVSLRNITRHISDKSDDVNRHLLKKMESIVTSEGNDPSFTKTIHEISQPINVDDSHLSLSNSKVNDAQRMKNFADGVRGGIETLLLTVADHQDELGFQIADNTSRTFEALKKKKQEENKTHAFLRKKHDQLLETRHDLGIST